MNTDVTGKVTAQRLRRDATSTSASRPRPGRRQHRVDAAAVRPAGPGGGAGWPEDRIHVIDIDQGHSGASAADRQGFQHLVAEVSLGRAGIVLGLECSG